MVKAIVFDFSRVLLFPKNEGYFGELNALHEVLSDTPNYNFYDNFVFNQELIDFIKDKCLEKMCNLYIFTSGNIQDTTECQRFLNGYFKKIFSASKMKLKKNKSSSYLILADKIGFNPGEILYIDDMRENTQAAEMAGFVTITFRNNIQFETEIEGYIHGR